MNELIFLSYIDEDKEIGKRISSDLKEQGYKVYSDSAWNLHNGTLILSYSNVLIVLVSASSRTSDWIKQRRDYAQQYAIPILYVLISEYAKDYLVNTDWINLSSPEQFQIGLAELLEKLIILFRHRPLSKYQLIEHELQQVKEAFPELLWMRFISADGLSARVHTVLDMDDERMRYEEADRVSYMSAATLSLGERIAQELALGELSLTIIAGKSATYFFLPMDDSQKWYVAIGIKRHPPIDAVLDYFQSQDFFAHLIPLL